MGTEYTLNRLDTSGVGPLVDRHWRELREAHENGKKVIWASGPLWAYSHAFSNIAAHFMAGYAAYCGGRKMSEEVLEAAERYGELKDTCSYHRLHTGMAAILKNGWHITDPRVLLPMPDLLVSGRACTEQSHYMEALHRRFGIKAITIELPTPRLESDLADIARYGTAQVKSTLIPALEELCGEKFDAERLRQVFRIWKETSLLRNRCWEYFKHKPALWTLWDYGVSMAPVTYAMGDPEGLVYYKSLLKQLEDRAAKNIPAIAPGGEKYRLLWDGWLPWAFLGKFSRLMVPRGAIPICGRYPWEFTPEPADINTEADDIVFEWMRLQFLPENATMFHQSPWGGEKYIEHFVDDYDVDGVLFFSSKTCRWWNLGQHQIRQNLERKYGIPGVVIEADMVDPAMVSEEQIKTRIEALLETIDARKR